MLIQSICTIRYDDDDNDDDAIYHLSADITGIVSADVIGDVTYLMFLVVVVVPQGVSRLIFNNCYDFGPTLPVIEDSRYSFDIILLITSRDHSVFWFFYNNTFE